MGANAISLTKFFDVTSCVFCGKKKKLTSTKSGCSKIREACIITNDDCDEKDNVFQRLSLFDNTNTLFFYHMRYSCYGKYVKVLRDRNPNRIMNIDLTEKNCSEDSCTLDKPFFDSFDSSFNDSSVEDYNLNNDILNTSEIFTTSSKSKKRRAIHKVCLICTKDHHFKDKRKVHLLEKIDRITSLMSLASKLINDPTQLHERIGSLSAQQVQSSFFYYHPYCLKKYERQLPPVNNIETVQDNIHNLLFDEVDDGDQSMMEENPLPAHPVKMNCIVQVVNNLLPSIRNGLGYTLSEITNLVQNSLPENRGLIVYAYEIKSYLDEHYSNEIEYSESKNKSPVAFSKAITKSDLIEKMRSINIYQQCGRNLRDILRKVDFDLDDKFCTVVDLQTSWNQIDIPTPVLDFLSGLYDFKKSSFLNFIEEEKKLHERKEREDRLIQEVRLSNNDSGNIEGGNIDLDDPMEAVSSQNEDSENVEDLNSDYFDSESEADDEKSESEESVSDDSENDILNNNNKNNSARSLKMLSKFKVLKIKSFFQQLHFMASKGQKKTPLHVMNAINIHSSCRSRHLIDCFHRFGMSISYQAVRLQRKRLAALIIHLHGKDNVPLPLSYVKNKMMKCMADNFDWVGPTSNTHESALVVSQIRSGFRGLVSHRISKTPVKNFKHFDFKLKCQKPRYIKKPTGSLILPSEFGLNKKKNEITQDMYKSSRIEDFLWMVSRRESSKKLESQQNNDCKQIIPTLSAFNSKMYRDTREAEDIRFLPLIPQPITELSSVYTIMCNFRELSIQLNQKLAFFCDEKVYCMARHIKFLRLQEFESLAVLMGIFHATKNVLPICGSYLRDSGYEHILVEGEMLSPNVTEQILNGTHYYRSSEAFFALGEALQRLQLEAFYKENFTDIEYEHEFNDFEVFIDCFSEKNYSGARRIFNRLKKEDKCQLFVNFQKFVKKRREESELFKYWDNVLIIIQLIRDLIRADRTGNWKLHCETMAKLLPLYHIFDHIHYLRWGSVYVQDILNLKKDFPELYKKFVEGYFTIKTSTMPNTSLAADLQLEKTAMNNKKNPGGIIGRTDDQSYVTEYDLTCHEELSVRSFTQDVCFVHGNNSEFNEHYELNKKHTENSEHRVKKIQTFISENFHVNPFSDGKQILRNIVTEEIPATDNKNDLLGIFENGCKMYQNFYNGRFYTKDETIDHKISKYKLKHFKTSEKESKDNQTSFDILKVVKLFQKMIDLARLREFPLYRLLTYECCEINYLFNSDGTMVKSKKSELTHELEHFLPHSEIGIPVSECVMVDVMLKCRKYVFSTSFSKDKTFSDLADMILSEFKDREFLKTVEKIHFVFDDYFDFSLKCAERDLSTLR